VAAAWFAGRDDPDLMLLSMPMREAEVWTSTDSTLHFGIEIVRASIDPDRMPDVGSHEVIRF
jgi:general stress protein 26